MQTDYIPRKDHAFNTFQRTLSEHCQANLVQWNINATAFGKFQTAHNPYETAYNKKTNKSFRTTVDVKDHRKQRSSYTKVLRTFVKEQIAGNTAISDSDRLGMRLKPMITKKGRRSAIDGVPTVIITSTHSANVKMTVRETTDSNRSSMHPLADAVEVVYMIGDKIPVSPKECNMTFISTKAKFNFDVGYENVGKRIYGFVRWKNIRNNSKSGEWSILFSRMISD